MNKVITDGLVLMPTPFTDGLDVWSSGNGTAGSATYDGAPNAAFVPADGDFSGCLELVKTETTQKLRFMAQTPILPGCYLRISARVKAISGNLPSVRIAGWAGDGSDVHVGGLDETGSSVALTGYGDIVEVSAIVGTGSRGGVDMAWGLQPVYGHFGLDLTGTNGGVVRIDDIVIEDITSAFLRDMIGVVDVRDFGAAGDGIADDSAAFAAADAAAAGRTVLVPEGTYLLEQNVTFDNFVKFEGTVTCAADVMLILRRGFDYDAYLSAFGDEVLAFEKAWQALLNAGEHESLDLCGRRIELDAPIDMQAAVPNRDTWESRRVIRNGQFNCLASSDWDEDVVTSAATYSPGNPTRLTGVANVAGIAVGSLVQGNGVGREVYVRSKDVGAQEIELSQPLYDAAGSQTFTFTRFKYVLDFSGFTKLSRLTVTDVEFQCSGRASAVMIAPLGEVMHFRDVHFTRPKHRGITSIGSGCQDLHVDRCSFYSDEQAVAATARVSIGFNVNANDAKIRDNRFQRLRNMAVLHGTGHLIVGNHTFGGDGLTEAPRTAAIVFTYPNVNSVITGNYIDNSWIEMTNEHDAQPDFASEFSFGGLTVTGNIFLASDCSYDTPFLLIRPHGADHFVQGLSMIGNSFRVFNGEIERVDRVDDSIADLDYFRTRNVIFEGNTFNAVDKQTLNPATLEFDQASDAATWTLNVGDFLPFEGNSRTVSSVILKGEILNGSDAPIYAMPSVDINAGADNNLINLNWPEPCRGSVFVTVRADRPI